MDRNDDRKIEITLRNKYKKNKCNESFYGYLSDNPKDFAENFFGWLNKIAICRSISQVKMYTNDLLLNFIPKDLFKETGNHILKNIAIAILKKPTYVHDASERQKIIEVNHDHPIFGGHIGKKRLYAKLRQDYVWPNMVRDVANHVKTCHHCQTNKTKTHTKTPMCITDTPIQAFDKLSIDTIGPLSITENGNRFALTILCNLSKYLIIIPIQNKEAKTVAKALFENVFLNYGLCYSILTDMGTEYVNNVMSEVSKLLDISHQTSTPYHPQTMGGVERSHRTMNEYLRIYLNENKNDWDNLLKYFAYCYNITPHSSFSYKYSPFELMFGRTPRSPEILQNITIEPIYNFDNFAKELKYNLQNANFLAKNLLIKSKELNKTQYDKNVTNRDFKKHDYVLILGKNHKLETTYDGPYVIIDIDDFNVTLKHEQNNQTKTVHKNMLIKYFKR